MIRSPGLATSMACWIEPTPVGDMEWSRTYFGARPTVTVTASIDCLPFPAVMSSSPQYELPAGPVSGCTAVVAGPRSRLSADRTAP